MTIGVPIMGPTTSVSIKKVAFNIRHTWGTVQRTLLNSELVRCPLQCTWVGLFRKSW